MKPAPKKLVKGQKLAAANIWVDDIKKGPLKDRLWVYGGTIVFSGVDHYQFFSYIPYAGGYRAHTIQQILDGNKSFRPFLLSPEEMGSALAREYNEL